MDYKKSKKGGGIKSLLLLSTLLLATHINANFNFGECQGSGTFEQQIHKYTNYKDAALVGTIPAGIKRLKVTLVSDKDVDIRLYGENNDKIVHWPYGLLNHYYQETKPYKDVPVIYSGYNGVEGEKGHEFIEVNGTTPTTMTMKAFGYKAGYATVNYSWTGKDNCNQNPNGTGYFTQTLEQNATSLVGTIPPNVENVQINLNSDKDLDIQLYGVDGTAIASWKPTGLMSGSTKQSIMFHDMNITWSGYNGTDGQAGHEYITVTPKTTEVLVMKVFGYEAGSSDVTYSWGNAPSDTTPPVITLNGDANLTLHQGDTYVELGATAVDDMDSNVSVDINSTVNTEIVGTYVVTYTAKDSAGNEAKITRNINVIKAVSIYGVITTNVYGNTAEYGYTARFQVSLKTKPDANVSMAVFSSDNNEGIVLSEDKTGRTHLIFGPDNWNIPQRVLVRGQNKNVVNGVQNYRVVLDAMVSDDENYDGLNPNDIEMKGEELKLLVPTSPQKCIVNLSKTIKIETKYNGMKTLVYSLENAPDGMTINEKKGKISWIPTSSDEGNSYTVSVKVTDGSLVDVVEFDMSVEVGRILQTEVNSNILTVIDNNSTLKGLQIIPIDSSVNLENVVLRIVPPVQEISDSIIRITDIFMIDTPIDGKIKIRLPLDNLPQDFDLMHESDRIGFYGLVDTDTMLIDYIKSGNGNLNIAQYSWMTTGNIWIPELINGKLILDVKLSGLEGLSFVGYRKKEIIESSSLKSLGLYKSLSVGNSCESVKLPDNSVNFKKQLCTIEETNSTIFLKNFGDTLLSTRWNGATSQDLISWIAEAQKKFDTLGLQYDKNFTIAIEDFSKTSARGALGFVRKYGRENRDILHLNQKNFSKNMMQGTSVHEYFHHAQARSAIVGKDLLIDGGVNVKWAIEGTARWFEDYVFNSLDTYVEKEAKNGVKILKAGLNASGSIGIFRPYQRFSFFKLLDSNCSNFYNIFKDMLNTDLSTDTSGIKNIIAQLSNASCDFGVKFDAVSATESSMESAMYAYQFATVQENDISLLDANESKNNFKFDPVFEVAKTQWIDDIFDIKRGLFMGKVAPYGAVSFRVNYDVLNAVDATPIFWKLKSNKDLLVVFTHLDKNNKGTTVLSSRGKMGLADRFYIPLKGNTEFKFNLLNEDMQGGMLVTLVNTSKDTVNINKLMMHGRFVRDDNKSIVTDYLRGIQWTDGYAGDGAFLYSYHDCSNLTWEGGNWSLPTLPSLNSIVDKRKKSPNPLVYDAFKNIEAKGYWADNWDYDLGTSTVVNFMNGANVEIPVDNTMNHICTRLFNIYTASKMSNPSENIYNQVIRD